MALPLQRERHRAGGAGRRPARRCSTGSTSAERASARCRRSSRGGERQRAALARAVILSPEVILADEPTGSVDWETATRLLALLVELNRMGKTVLVATHDRT